MDKNEIQHFGIPGMKWGVRKARKPKKATSSKKKAAAEKLKKEYKNGKNSPTVKKGRRKALITLGIIGGVAVAGMYGLGKAGQVADELLDIGKTYVNGMCDALEPFTGSW